MDKGRLQRIVGVNLRAYRTERGYSQEDFADHLNVHRTYMGAIERGERNLTLQTLEALAYDLDVDPLDLLTLPSNRPKP